MERKISTLRELLLIYATVFFRQYIAYLLQDPFLFRNHIISLPELAKLSTGNQKVEIVQKTISSFLKTYENDDPAVMGFQWAQMVSIPEYLAGLTGVRVGVIIDEFQDMNDNIYNSRNIVEIDPSRHLAVDLPVTYRSQASSRITPMLVSGSAVTMIFNTVMGGALAGRFSFSYLKPMSTEDGALLVSTELALYLSYQLGGHPFYINCCAKSAYPAKDFSSREAIDELIDYEVTKGEINGFWQTHFQENKELIN